MLVAIDPSITSSGVAAFVGGRLLWAKRIKVKRSKEDVALRSLTMASAIVEAVGSPDVIAFERPQIYQSGKGEGDPNDLPALLAIGVATAAILRPRELVSYYPREWAGQLKKTKSGDCRESPRAIRIHSRLESEGEIAVWSALRPSDHDVIDAIGIGLHHLGRLERRRVFHGASS